MRTGRCIAAVNSAGGRRNSQQWIGGYRAPAISIGDLHGDHCARCRSEVETRFAQLGVAPVRFMKRCLPITEPAQVIDQCFAPSGGIGHCTARLDQHDQQQEEWQRGQDFQPESPACWRGWLVHGGESAIFLPSAQSPQEQR